MRQQWTTFVYLLALMLYVLAGTPVTPFHGDESTLIYGSRDYFDQFVAGDWARVMNRRSDDANDHELRLLDGRVQKYLGGFVFHLTGGTRDGLNRPWQWGAPAQISIREGFVPSLRLLMAERWAMAALLALSIPVAYAIGAGLGGRAGGLLMATLIAVSPNLVMNSRRAMMEAPLLLFSLLTVLAAIKLASAVSWRNIVLFGLAGGLALASKHSAVLVVAPLVIALIALSRKNSPALVQFGAASVVMLMIFLALNPAWWSSPVSAASETLRLRAELMKMQTSVFGGYASVGASAAGFIRYAILEVPQYFEFPSWQELGPSIAAYRASPWVLPPVLNGLRALVTTSLALVGIVVLIRRRDAVALVAAAWIIVVIVAAAVLTPVPWARYYLPALPAIYALAAAGAGGLAPRHQVHEGDAVHVSTH